MNMRPLDPYRVHAAYETRAADEKAAFLRKVYAIMAVGLAATGATAYAVATTDALARLVLGNPLVFYGLIATELVVVWTFSGLVARVTALSAAALFLFYSVINGATLSVIFFAYSRQAIATSFFVTAGMFALVSAYGAVTKRNLDGVAHFALMGLVGLLLASIVNIFLGSSLLYWLTTFVGVIVFTCLVAYDTKKILELNVIGNAGTDEDHKEAIHGALVLYLDFVNLFLYLLRLFGGRRR